ncbi:hypothetical protein BpHYR1_000306 [Brachionus plicatilis]|uniref:Uncharacterized protein n=1 Tax=Brachionus plicatilis TaxID=10195 RepID=A0A3M7SI08_BRAPC|nr:hypothetical protein BpHYR1_000306 [Brachionus plicatilis]
MRNLSFSYLIQHTFDYSIFCSQQLIRVINLLVPYLHQELVLVPGHQQLPHLICVCDVEPFIQLFFASFYDKSLEQTCKIIIRIGCLVCAESFSFKINI